MTNTPFTPVLRTQADVESAWRALIHPLGWPQRRLWFMFVDADGTALPLMSEIDEFPDEVDRDLVDNAVRTWQTVLQEIAPGGRVALLLCRPGVGGPTAEDLAIARVLYDACRDAGLPTEVIHLATDVDISPLPADEVLSRSA